MALPGAQHLVYNVTNNWKTKLKGLFKFNDEHDSKAGSVKTDKAIQNSRHNNWMSKFTWKKVYLRKKKNGQGIPLLLF